MIRRLRNAQLAAHCSGVLALGQQPISGHQLTHNLLRAVPFPRCHDLVEPSCPRRGPQDSHKPWINQSGSGHKERVRELRPAYLPPDPAGRTTYEPGEIAQCDLWFPPTTVPVGYGQVRTPVQLPVLTMVCGYSRWLSGILIPSRRGEDL